MRWVHCVALRALREIHVPATLSERIARRLRTSAGERDGDEGEREARAHRAARVRSPRRRCKLLRGDWAQAGASGAEIDHACRYRRPRAPLDQLGATLQGLERLVFRSEEHT